MKSLIIVYSYHHKNTEKIAKVMAEVLGSQIKAPKDIDPEEIQNFDLIGFGSGIYGAKFHKIILNLADNIPIIPNKKAFLFSTAALTNKKKIVKDHSEIREKLEAKGFEIVDEFQCKGFNTNSFLKYFKGMNKGRPNTEDLKNAEDFAKNLNLHVKN